LSLTADGNPCGECQNCRSFDDGSLLDVIEIDAASNTGVDNIRDMIERAQFQPTQAPYKVYIIDEVHMLSKGAFNALLKTLEEPPKHVKFILATTEIHKIPDTIISRSQRFDFKRIKNDDIITQLHAIAHSEKIEAEEAGLELIARLAKWGMRDAITLFEQYSVGGTLKRKYIEENLELIGDDFLSDFVESLVSKNSDRTLKNLAFLREKSLDVRLFLEQLLFFLRDQMKESLKKPTFGAYALLFETFEGIYGRLKFSPDPFLLLETSVFRCIASHDIKVAKNFPEDEKNGAVATRNTPKKEEKIDIPQSVQKTEEKASEEKPTTSFDFSRFVEHIRTVPKRSFVWLGLRVATYSEEGNTIIIHPDNDFNHKKLDSADVRLFLQETLDTLFGAGYRIDIRRWGTGTSAHKTPSLADDAMDIF
jgi:DNA polymerase III gamma/tau subunit